MFTYTKTYYKKVTTTKADGTKVEEVTSSTKPDEKAEAEAAKMEKEIDDQFKKMDAFFAKMNEAFNLLK